MPAAKQFREDIITLGERVQKQSPYNFQRNRQLFNKQPRPPQANISQPNAKGLLVGWGLSTREYWQSVFEDYLQRKKLTRETSLRMGREQ